MALSALPGDEAILDLFERLALDAGRAVMAVYATDFAADAKADASPVTAADHAAEAIILAGLRKELPGAPCVAEEEVAAGRVPDIGAGPFILVDPLDGTREFVSRNGDFTVNIALVRGRVPVVGVVYAPARGMLYSGRPGAAFAVATADGAIVGRRRAIAVRPPREPLSIVASRSHLTPETAAFIDRFPGAETVSVGSSLKFCLLASGEADLYPRFGRTMEWDTAAGDAVLRAAGGRMRRPDGSPLLYGKRGQAEDVDFANPWFVADVGEAVEAFRR
ncbi:MAG: 3'(2'),5'-bisphosphate nucleotidase CysQ [Rhizobiaceae bacterium]|nr:MAG: 3'(2'),5'-bisphosphate nucleotidase CysQ [Rhizobiaceae bacterium]CAG0989688.1 3'(2'), 5'-bisphosphate nucleotidase [Rhizobiaceae bacterium]